MGLSKAEILGAGGSLAVEEVSVPEFGDGATVFVRELTGDERDAFDGAVIERDGELRGLRALICSLGLCDENGTSLGFTDSEIDALGQKSGAAIDRIFERVKKLSGMNETATEDAEKNLPADQSGNSG